MRNLTSSATFSNEDIELAKTFAEEQFWLAEKQSDGRSLRDHLENIQRQIGEVPDQLKDLTELPEAMVHCWRWFLDLNRTREAQMGVSAISYREMQAYFELHSIEPLLEEVEVIKMFDVIAGNEIQKQSEKSKKTPKDNKNKNE